MKYARWLLVLPPLLLFWALWILRPTPAHRLALAIVQDDGDAIVRALKRGADKNEIFGKQGVYRVQDGTASGTMANMETPLTFAIASEHWNAADTLLRQGVDPNGRKINGLTPLDVLLSSSDDVNFSTARVLVRSGADVRVAKGALLFDVTKQGDVNLVRLVLEHGADARRLDPNGHSVLDYIDANWTTQNPAGSREIRRMLVAHGAKITPSGALQKGRAPGTVLPPYFVFPTQAPPPPAP